MIGSTQRSILAGLAAFALGCPAPAWGQFTTDIQTDGSLPGQSGGIGNIDGMLGIFEIGEADGYRTGPTLFHSFHKFDLGTGDTALFSADPSFTTQNIVGRVTGGMQSRIDGILASDVVGANLYLLNPSGVLFGPNASLDLTGSFHATTAESLEFADGELFEASFGGAVPLLSATDPGAFGFLGDAPITVQSISLTGAPEIDLRGGRVAFESGDATANRVTLEGRLKADMDADSTLQSSGSDGSIVILGGDLFLRGVIDTLTAPGGTGPDIRIDGDFVEISRVDPVDIDNPFVNVQSAPAQGNGGNVSIRGNTIVLRNTVISTRTFADSPGRSGDISIDAGSLEMIGSELLTTGSSNGNSGSTTIHLTDGPFILNGGGIFASTGNGGGGDIEIRAPAAFVNNGAIIQASTFGSGDAGDITFEVDTLRIETGGFINSSVGLVGTGHAGTVSIRAGESVEIIGEGELGLDILSLLLTGDGTATGIAAITGGAGDAGAIEIDAPIISISNGGAVAAFGGGGVFGPGGDAGDITMRGDRIEILSGGLVDSGSAFKGRGGSVSLIAGESVVVSGSSESGVPSRIRSFNAGSDPGGDITIRAPLVEISEGGVVSASTVDLLALGFMLRGGQAGNVLIEADSLSMSSGGRIDSSSFSRGDGGLVVVNVAENISLTGANTGIFGQAGSSGSGGQIELSAETVEIRNGAAVSTEAMIGLGESAPIFEDLIQDGFTFIQGIPVGDGGSIEITASDRIELEGAQVSSASATFGDGGSLQLNAPKIRLDEAAITTRSTFVGDAGRIELNVADLRLDASEITAEALNAFGGSISINGESIETLPDGTVAAQVRPDQQQGDVVRLRDSQISTSVGLGSGDGGNVLINSEFVIFENEESGVKATAVGGDGGNILLETDFAIAPEGNITAVLDASSQSGVAGAVEVSAPNTNVMGGVTALDTPFQDASELMRTACAAREPGGDRSSFHVAGLRGMPPSPENPAKGFADLPLSADAPPGLRTGADFLREGRYNEALAQFQNLTVEFEAAANPLRLSDALRGLASTQQAIGLFDASLEPLTRARAIADAQADPARAASALAGIATAELARGDGAGAHAAITRAIASARSAGRPQLVARIENRFANDLAAYGRPTRAVAAHERAARLAHDAHAPEPEARALSDAARTVAADDPGRARELLVRAESLTRSLPDGRARMRLDIHQAKTRSALLAAGENPAQTDLLTAHRSLQDAVRLANQLDAPRALSIALGNLGALYETERRSDEAIQLTRRALEIAERAGADDIGYRWHWQEGRLLWAGGRASDAIRSYRRAVRILERIRPESLSHNAGQFKRSVAPIYIDYVDALLQSSGRIDDPADAQRLLIEARSTTEQLKVAELRDYFRDECVAEIESTETDLDRVSRESGAAVVYPILLPDRSELLVSLPSGIERFVVPVGSTQMNAAIQAFRGALTNRASYSYRAPARQLYDWLVAPYASRLSDQQISTLVFVPDGPLRTIPMAALYDGERYLVERFALAVTPGLSLVDPTPLDAQDAQFLIAGLSESVQGFEALPNTASEVEAIHSLYGGSVLIDGDFRADRVETEIASTVPSVVHLASHAVFSGSPETSFVLTFDDRMNMDRLASVVASTQFREQKLELLALSACETAAGDDRAALGLAGVAIRAGARSALGSLWPVMDEATADLFRAFYTELRRPGVSKAEALRRAQRLLLEDRRFGHPYYWSAFLMINNWL